MPKASDPQCPLGFHPQFRRPNYCKRCFREYGDHKQCKDVSGSNTSINSLSFDRNSDLYGSRESITSSRVKDDVEGHGYNRSRSDLTTSSLSKSTSDYESKGGYTRSRPMSWSAQDLRKAVDEAKEQVRSSRDDVQRSYGSVRSLTQDLGSLDKLREGPTISAKEKEESKYSKEAESSPKASPSFSSYLAMRTKSPGRPPILRTSSLPSSQGITPIKEESRSEISSIKESSYEKPKPEWKASSGSSILRGEGLPPKVPLKVKADPPSLPEVSERKAEEKPNEESTGTSSRRATIQCLRKTKTEEEREVKSEDADAAYVIHLKPKPKKETPTPKKVEIDLQPELERLNKEMKELNHQINDMQEKNESLESINNELMAKKPRFGDIKKQADITKLQLKIEELSDEIKGKSKDVKDMKKELQKRPLPKDVEKTMEDLRSKLQAAEQLCEELMDENEDYKKEVRTLEDEIEEMQDNFREDQADEYRDLKREIEQRAKDCRVLQFKLKKAERRSDQLERDKGEVEVKLKDLQVGETDSDKVERLSALEKELNLAKEISMKMHEEMKKMKDQLEVAETDKKKLKEKVQDTPMKVAGKVSRSQMMGRQGSQDNTEQILRDLQDSQEREQDVKEQLRFAEEETKNLRKKLSRMEEENETLQLQLNKMSSKAKQSRQRSMERTGSFERSSSVERGSLSRQGSTEKPPPNTEVNGEELDPTELKIQLELNEQESVVHRRKIEDLEADNHRLQKELKDILSTMSESKPSTFGKSEVSKNSIYLHQMIRSLEKELSEFRRKVSETERERDQIKVDLESAKKRNRITRTRSTENDDDIDQVKAKIKEYETANEHLLDENKRLQLQAQKRLPLTVHEKMYIDNQVLEEKIKRVEKKLKETNEKLKTKSSLMNSETIENGVSKNAKIEELQAKIDQLQGKYDKISKDNEEIKTSTPYVNRTPKVPKDFTPKSTLVKWVNELEEECANLYAKLKLMGIENKVLEKGKDRHRAERRDSVDSEMCHLLFSDCETLRSENFSIKNKLDEREKEVKLLKQNVTVIESDVKDMQESLTLYRDAQKKVDSSLDSDEWNPVKVSDLTPKSTLRKNVERLNIECAQLHSALRGHKRKKDTNEDIDLQDKLQREKERNEELTRQLQEERDKSLSKKNTFNDNDIKPYEERIQNLRKDLKDERKKIEEFERKLAEGSLISIDKFRMMQKENKTLQRQISDSQQTLFIVEKKLKEKEETLKISEKAETNLRSLLEKADMRETQLLAEKTRREEAEDRGREERDEKRRLRIERDQLRTEFELQKMSFQKAESDAKQHKQKLDKEIDKFRKEKEDYLIRMTTLESELKAERKKRERMETDNNVGLKGKTSEIEDYRERVQKLEVDKTRLSIDFETTKKESDIRIKALERSLSKEAKGCDDWRKKHELLEEDCVLLKAQLYDAKDGDYTSLKKEYDTIERELKRLRETYNHHQDIWIKEKLDMQIKVKDLESKSKDVGGLGYSEKSRLRNIIDDKTQQIESLRSEGESLNSQISFHRREAEDMKKKADDLEKLQEFADKRQSSVSAGTRQYEITIKELKARMSNLERIHRTDTNKMKIRYDTKVKALSEEVSTLTHHMTKYRRERDTYKQMLDGAQKAIAELKSGSYSSYRTSRADTATEANAHLNEVQDLQSNVTELEDKLADARLEVTKVKNELVDQKVNFDIQLCILQTKLNEYEEDRLLEGAARRVPGLRTRLELNWQKEREEQQRLVQETCALAKDLRQTLYEVERERDMDRIEAKRKIDQLKKTISLEHQDTKGKVQELQRDLLDLREAHAKLRQINEKLRREKDRTEVEREAMRDKFLGSSREFLNQQTKMEKLLHELKRVKDLFPHALGEDGGGESSKLTAVSNPQTKGEFEEALKKLTKTSDDLKIMMGLGDERDRLRRTPSFRRALSTESDDEGGAVRSRSAGARGAHRPIPRIQKSQLYRKAQSLDHQMADERGKIWVSTDAGSTSSIESAKTDDPRKYRYDPDSSFERMSTGSQTSDLDLAGEQKAKGMKSVFSMFGKTKSSEDSINVGGLTGSGGSLASEPENSVSAKLKTLFKKNSSTPQPQTSKENVNVRKVASKFDTETESLGSKPAQKPPPRALKR